MRSGCAPQTGNHSSAAPVPPALRAFAGIARPAETLNETQRTYTLPHALVAKATTNAAPLILAGSLQRDEVCKVIRAFERDAIAWTPSRESSAVILSGDARGFSFPSRSEGACRSRRISLRLRSSVTLPKQRGILRLRTAPLAPRAKNKDVPPSAQDGGLKQDQKDKVETRAHYHVRNIACCNPLNTRGTHYVHRKL